MRRRPLLALSAVVVLSACGDTPAEDDAAQAPDDVDGVEVEVRDVDDSTIGTVTFQPGDDGVTVTAALGDLEPGFHGFHVHAEPLCEPDAAEGAFMTAGGHYMGDGGDHSDHAGDMPSLYATADGRATLTLVTDRFTVDELTSAGTAVVVHEAPDNFANVPDRYVSQDGDEPGPDDETLDTGDSGGRVACGVIEAS